MARALLFGAFTTGDEASGKSTFLARSSRSVMFRRIYDRLVCTFANLGCYFHMYVVCLVDLSRIWRLHAMVVVFPVRPLLLFEKNQMTVAALRVCRRSSSG